MTTCLLLLLALSTAAATGPSAGEILGRSDLAFYYAGADQRARVTMELVSASGDKRTRSLTMLRRNLANREQRYYMYFHQPGDVRGMSFLVWKYPQRDDDRWMFIPALDSVRRVAASDSGASFFGSDFSYEDLSGRDLELDDHILLREESLGGAPCWVIESHPKRGAAGGKRLSWIDKGNYLPRRREYFDAQEQRIRIFTAEAIDVIRSSKAALHPTITRMSMLDTRNGHRTNVGFTEVAYDLDLAEDLFTQRSLQRPPAGWVH